MAQRKFDIWQGPIIGYGDATGLSAGGKFKRPDDVKIPPRPKRKNEPADYEPGYRRQYSASYKKEQITDQSDKKNAIPGTS